MAVVSPHTTVAVIQTAIQAFSVHQLNTLGVHSQPLVRHAQDISVQKRPEFSARRQHFMLHRVFKMQVLRGATIHCSRGCLFATCPQLVWKVKFQGKKQVEIKSAITRDPGPRRTSEGGKRSISPPSMPCLSDFTTKLAAGNVSVYSICAGCVRELCERKRAWKQEQAGSLVAGMITSLDLSHGKNKTSISHYLPFNQIPGFFASLPQNCHRLKISPFLIKEPRVQLIPRQGEFYSETLMHTKRMEKTPASPIRQITSDF